VSDQPTSFYTTVAECANGKIIFTSNDNPFIASQRLQSHDIEAWYSK